MSVKVQEVALRKYLECMELGCLTLLSVKRQIVFLLNEMFPPPSHVCSVSQISHSRYMSYNGGRYD